MKVCFSCGKKIEVQDRVGRQEICPHCRGDLHCCLNCNLYDEYAQNQCRESSAEWVNDREKNNFCEYFIFKDSESPGSHSSKQKEALEKLEALFKKKTS